MSRLKLFLDYCRLGDINGVQRMLEDRFFEPSDISIPVAVAWGHIKIVNQLLLDERVDPSAGENCAIRWAADYGQLAVVERLLQDKRVDPSARNNYTVRIAAREGHLAVVERLLQDERVDPSENNNEAVQWAAENGHLAVVERLLQDERVDPSDRNNEAVRCAVENGHFKVVERLLEDKRTSIEAVLQTCPENNSYFEYRKRFTEICIALQDLNLPAWITMKILQASKPWNKLPIHKRWELVCTVKHFLDRKSNSYK